MYVRPIFVAALASVVYAYPTSFSFTSLISSLNNPVLINTTSIISKRQFNKPHSDFNNPCGIQPDGYGPQPDVDSADGFLNFAGFAALTYDEHSPAYYRSVFQKIDAAINFNGNGTYLGAINLDSYNTTRCQEICDEMDGCAAFNIYLERDPSLHPHHTEGCPDPPSITNIKCSFFDQYVTGDMAVNSGQTRADFEVVITQSSAYNKSPIPSFSGFTPPVALIGKHENVTETVNGKTAYTGIFDEIEGTYDISQCADHCNLITLTNRANPDPDGSYLPCNYFSAHQHTIDEGRYALNCMYFTVPLGREYVNYYGDRRGDSWHGVTDSWGFSTKVQDPGQVTPPP